MWLKTPYVVEKVDADVIIVGSSKATHHYIPAMIADSLGVSVYNCGQDGCFYRYQNCIINMVLDRYKPKTIIWDIQPGCLNAVGGERFRLWLAALQPKMATSLWHPKGTTIRL